MCEKGVVAALSLPVRQGGGPLRTHCPATGWNFTHFTGLYPNTISENCVRALPRPIRKKSMLSLCNLAVLWENVTVTYITWHFVCLTQYKWLIHADSRIPSVLPHSPMTKRSLPCLTQFLPCPHSVLPDQFLGFYRSWRRVLWERLEIPRVVLGEKCGTVVICGDSGWEKEKNGNFAKYHRYNHFGEQFANGWSRKWAYPPTQQLFLRIYPRETYTCAPGVWPRAFTEALFVITKKWPCCECPSAGGGGEVK